MGNLTPVTTTPPARPRRGRAARRRGARRCSSPSRCCCPRPPRTTTVELPDALPGGWVAADLGRPRPTTMTPTPRIASGATDYVRDVYAEVYDEPVAFRAYTDEDLVDVRRGHRLQRPTAARSARPTGSPTPRLLGLKRAPTELVRRGDVVCVANYQPVAEGQDDPEGSDVPARRRLPAPHRGAHHPGGHQRASASTPPCELVHEVEDDRICSPGATTSRRRPRRRPRPGRRATPPRRSRAR